MFLLNQLKQLALAQDRVGEIQACKLDLLGMMNTEVIEKPVVERTVIFELQRADRMSDPFYRIRLTMGKIVRWINTPRISGAKPAG